MSDTMTPTLTHSEIRTEYQRRYRELCDQYGADDIWQTRGLDSDHHIVWVVPRDELWRLEEWHRQQYERLAAVRVGAEKAADKALERQQELDRREREKHEARQEREAQRANRPVFVGNDCRVCGELIPSTGRRGRQAVVHDDCRAEYKAQQKAEYEAGRCQLCRHESHEGKTCSVSVIASDRDKCGCEGEIVDMS